MSAPIFREYRQCDIPALTALWSTLFGDSETFVSAFFRHLPDMGSCLVMELKGKIMGMASVITGCELAGCGSPGKEHAPVIGYIYALGIGEDFQGNGFGSMLAQKTGELAVSREADIVCTLPASESLYSFYEKALGFKTALFRKRYETVAEPVEMTMKLSATEYSMFRNSMVGTGPYLHPSFFTTDFLKSLCEEYGGGLFASESGICSAQTDNGTCVIHELICRGAERCRAVAASVAAALGCEKAVWFTPALPSDPGAEPFIAAPPGSIPENTVWNIAFE